MKKEYKILIFLFLMAVTGILAWKLVSFKYRIENPDKFEVPQDYLIKAQDAHQAKKYARAEKLYLKAIDVEPDSLAPYDSLGRLYLEDGNLKALEQLIARAEQNYPTKAAALFLATMLMDKQLNDYPQNYAKLEKKYQQAVERNSQNIPALIKLGAFYVKSKRLPEAIAAYLAILKLAPEVPAYQAEIGGVYLEMGEFEKARQYFQTALQLHPDQPYAVLGMAEVYLHEKNYPLAELYYQKTLKFYPDEEEAFLGLAKIAALKGDYPKALELLNQTLELGAEVIREDRNPTTYLWLAWVYRQLKREDEARQQLQTASQILPGWEEYPYYRDIKARLQTSGPEIKTEP